MARARIQDGCIRREHRKSGDVWLYRYYVDRESDGKRVERNQVVANVSECRSKTAAWQRIHDLDLRSEVNKPNFRGLSVTFGTLSQLYFDKKLFKDQTALSHTTAHTYRMYLRRFIQPRWDSHIATRVSHGEVEDWLQEIKTKHELADRTVAHIKQLMGLVYQFAIHREVIQDYNPIRKVIWKVHSDFRSVVIKPEQARAIYNELHAPENLILLLTSVTGLRCSEVLGLKWEDIDVPGQKITVRQSWSMGKKGRPKSKASRHPVPCIPQLSDFLVAWRKESLYSGEEDWVFPSRRNKGRTPRSGSTLVTDHFKAAAVRAGVIKAGDKRPFGLHVLRHSLATSLISWGLDVKTVQGMLRHANSQTTLDIYTQEVSANSLTAQRMMMSAVMKPASETVQ